LAVIMALPDAHRFEFKEGAGPSGLHQGFFAQDIETVMPEFVHMGAPTVYTPKGTLQFDKNEYVADLIQGMKAQQQEIASLSPGISPYHRCVSWMPILCDAQ
jgi:hypothetical protein